ncbi:MAG: hypothetical protein K2H38_09865 [Muribaculaceae bacterium]|nr:hypothetical protein [Muribaculaceae bacterium]
MKNRHNKRAWWHDYYSRSIYLITINKRPEAPLFGQLTGDWRIPPGCQGCPEIRLSDIGKTIRKWIKRLPSIVTASDEKNVRAEVEKFGGRVILICDKSLPPPPWKPAYSDFYRCARGELLILAPTAEQDHESDSSEKSIRERRQNRRAIINGKVIPVKKKILRAECLHLNALAEYICSDKFNSKRK